MSRKLKLLFGTDPEVFATYRKDGKIYALPPVFFRKVLGVPASKDERHPVFFEMNGCKFHEDGAAFELAVKPSYNPRELFEQVGEVISRANAEIISPFGDYVEPLLQFLPTVNWEVERWKDEGEDFFMATRFGCDPDFDAFDFDRRSEVVDARNWGKRYGGGHIHISGSKLIAEEPLLAIKCLALTAGCAAVHFSDSPDLDRDRTYLYGRPGKYRIQNYGDNPYGKNYSVGIEYRTPSNRWAGNWKLAEKIFKWAQIGIENLLHTNLGVELVSEFATDAAHAIVDCDQETTGNILAEIERRM